MESEKQSFWEVELGLCVRHRNAENAALGVRNADLLRFNIILSLPDSSVPFCLGFPLETLHTIRISPMHTAIPPQLPLCLVGQLNL
jgi:hypothetical protein